MSIECVSSGWPLLLRNQSAVRAPAVKDSRLDDLDTDDSGDHRGLVENSEQQGAPDRFSGRQIASGGLWTVLTFGLAQALRFGSSLVMTRLLMPEAFGVMAIVWSVLQGLNLFSDIGIHTSIVQNKRGADRAFQHTAWTLQIIRNAILCAIAAACAPLVGLVYPDYPGLTPLIQVCAISFLIEGFGSISLSLLDRNLVVAKMSLIELASQAITVIGMVVWAMQDPSPWALVGGVMCGTTARVLLGHILCGGDRFGWDRESVTALMAWGRLSVVSSLLMFLSSQADRLLFGALIPASLLGVYSLGMQLAGLAPDLVLRLQGKILFPVLCRGAQGGEQLSETFASCRRPLLILGGWSLAGACGGGQVAVSLIYPDDYLDAGWILQLLAMGLWFGVILQGHRKVALMASGLLSRTILISFGKLLSMLVMVPLGFAVSGFPGAVLGYAASDVCQYLVSVWASASIRLNATKEDMRMTIWMGLSALAGWIAARSAESLGLSVLAQCIAVAIVVSLAWAPLAMPMARIVLGRFRRV